MDNTLGFEENKTNVSEHGWHAGKSVASLGDIDKSESHSIQRLTRQYIEVIPQKKIHTDRPIIPATLLEKLSYYRAFTSSSSKIEMMCMQQNNVNRFIWFYISNALCKSLPMTYVYIFLSAYAPDQHLFVSKMVPISYGLSWINVVCARFLLQTNAYNIADHIHYAISGLLFRAPWNRCDRRIRSVHNKTYTCMQLEEFKQQFVNKTITFSDDFYITPTGDLFTLAYIDYFEVVSLIRTQNDPSKSSDKPLIVGIFLLKDGQTIAPHCGDTDTYAEQSDLILEPCKDSARQCLMFIINVSVWIVAAALYKQIFKRSIWKVLHYTQLVLIVLLFLIFCHLVASYEDKPIQAISAGKIEEQREILMKGDFDMLAESMTAPPVAHILSSRTTSEIKPSLNSAVIVFSNGAYYIFKALTSYLMKRYCERWVNATIIYWNYGSGSRFYFWPIYFDTIQYGSVLCVIYFILNAIEEYCMFVISFQCLVEMIQYEWPWLKPWLATGIIVTLAILEVIFVERLEIDAVFSENSFIFYMSLASLAEILLIFWVYPLNRFLDDITFHFGATPTRLRKWSFLILPHFYLYKMITMLYRFYIFSDTDNLFNVMHQSRSAPTCIATMFALGALYAFYHHIIRKKRGFGQLFKPVPEWGPKDYTLRQLRKKFVYREYIRSQAPRDLSRYLIEKSDLGSYKLDMVYNFSERRPTLYSYADEKDE